MKPAWKSSQAESLKKAPLCAETLEKLCMTELNIVNIIIQTTNNTINHDNNYITINNTINYTTTSSTMSIKNNQ